MRGETQLPNGKKKYYEGEKGSERKVRAEYPDGNKLFYEGLISACASSVSMPQPQQSRPP